MNLVLNIDNQEAFYDCLVRYGVSQSHLNAMKCKILNKDAKFSYPDIESERIELVPLNKISYIRRIPEKGNVFEVIYNKLSYVDTDSSSCSKLSSCFSYAEKQPLDKLLNSFANADMMKVNGMNAECIIVYYFVDEDTYYVEEGNHRVLTAMIFNSSSIWCKVYNARREISSINTNEKECILSVNDKQHNIVHRIISFLSKFF